MVNNVVVTHTQRSKYFSQQSQASDLAVKIVTSRGGWGWGGHTNHIQLRRSGTMSSWGVPHVEGMGAVMQSNARASGRY